MRTRKGSPVRKAAAALLAVFALAALTASPASAQKTRLFLETFGSAAQPSFHGSTNLALDPSSGDLYVLSLGGGFDKGEISRFKPNGEPEPFSALGTNTIDARPGPGGKACAEEAASCDDAPQVGFTFSSFPQDQGLAVDDSGTLTDGNVYVTELEHFGQGLTKWADYFTAFAADGHYLGQLTMAGATPLKRVCGVTVDSAGNVFVAELAQEQEIGPKSEILKEPEGRIYKFDPSANPPLSSDLVATFTFSPEYACSLAAGAGPTAGSLFARASGPEGTKVLKLNAASGAVEGVIPPTAGVSGSSKAVSVDPFDGHVFTEGREYEMSGASPVLLSGSNAFFGTASNSATERLYASGDFSGSKVRVLGPIVTLPEAATGSYEITGDTSARVKGTVNPDGQALSECSFEYGPTSAYGQVAPCEAPNAAEVGAGAAPVEVHADLSGLQGESEYHYRLVARNANAALYPDDPSAVVRGADQVFKTPSKPGIKGVWATNVIVTEATLKATINPENSPTSYRFEWGPDTSYGEATAEQVVAAGIDSEDHTVSAELGELKPATTYHYRVVATNGIGVTESDDRQFTTFAEAEGPDEGCENKAFRKGASAGLPDCRAYELLSPVDKEGEDVAVGPGERLDQSAASGDALAYTSKPSPTAYAQHLAARGAEGWSAEPISPPTEGEPFDPGPQESPFAAFSADLSEAWLRTASEPLLAAGGIAGYDNLYRRDNGAGTYEACTTAKPPSAPPGDYAPQVQGTASGEAIFAAPDKLTPDAAPSGGEAGQKRQLYDCKSGALSLLSVLPDRSPSALWNTVGTASDPASLARGATLAGAVSPDASHVYWSAGEGEAGPGALYLRTNPEAPESARQFGAATGKGNLLGPAAGIGNLIKGVTSISSVIVGKGKFVLGQAISGEGIAAGATIVECTPSCEAPTKLKMSKAATLSKSGVLITGAASASVSGVVVSTGAFAAGQEVSGPGIPAGATVLSCAPSCGAPTSLTLSAPATQTTTATPLSATSKCTEAATKACTLAVSSTGSLFATMQGRFWAASSDGSKALFSSGTDLYRYDSGEAKATLLAAKVIGVLGQSADLSRVYLLSTEALGGKGTAGEPNLYLSEGAGFEFIATLSDRDAEAGAGQLSPANPRPNLHTARTSPDGGTLAFTSDSEALAQAVSGYDNAEAESGKPAAEIYLYDAAAKGIECVSCNRSGSRPEGREVGGLTAAALPPTAQTSLYPGRPLSADGARLFFDSFDPLLPKDTNGKADVYQWEAAGTGDCSEAKASFSPPNGGCIALISSGEAPTDSEFIDASPEGDDVFLASGESLLSQDPGEADIYDARVGGGFAAPAEGFTLTVTKSGTGTGTVTSSPAGIDCGATCAAEFPENEVVTLSKAASAGSEFKEWTGACSGTGSCEVTISSAKAVGAVFNLIPRTLTIAKAGSGTGEVKCKVGAGPAEACAASYPNGTALKVEATASAGSTFAGFSVGTGSAAACSTSPCSFTIEANSTLTATFNTVVKPKFKLTVSKSGSGAGTVTSTPAGINCGATCEAEFDEGTEVTLSQSAAAGSQFTEWSGACSGSGACKVTMSAAKAVGAKFDLIARTLTIAKAGTGTGEVKCKFNGGAAGACTSPQPNGTAVEVIATANAGSTFAGFSAGTGSASACSTSPCSFTIEANSTLTATFNTIVKPKFKLTVSKSGTRHRHDHRRTLAEPADRLRRTCEAEYDEGTEVTLSQSAAAGSQFTEWTGACSGSGACKVTISTAKAVGAKLRPDRPHPDDHQSGQRHGRSQMQIQRRLGRGLHQPPAQRHRGRSHRHGQRRLDLRRLQRRHRLGIGLLDLALLASRSKPTAP